MGLIHEHKKRDVPIRWNREKWLDFYRALTGWTKAAIEDQILTSFDGSLLAATQFDPRSIMIYPIPPEVANVEASWTNDLSAMDKLFIGTQYPFSEMRKHEMPIALDKEVGIAMVNPGEILGRSFKVGGDGCFRRSPATRDAPAIIGLMDQLPIGTKTVAAAAEGNPATFFAEIRATAGNPPGTYHLNIRHMGGRTGTGNLRLRVRPCPPAGSAGGN